MKKSIIKRIEEEAAKLPIKLTTRSHTRYRSIKNKSIASKLPISEEINHVERMKSAYKTGGWDGVEKYITNQTNKS